MPFLRPSLSDLTKRNDSQMSSRMGIGPLLRRSVLGAISRIMSGASHMLHGHIAWASNQILPDTSESEILARQASIWGVQRKTAEIAQGVVDFTFSQAGTLEAGTKLRRADGVEYEVVVGIAPVLAGTYPVTVRAVAEGESGNSELGQVLTLVSPVAFVSQSASVISMDGGADRESDDRLRARLLARIQEPPNGGSASDYIAWALEISAVTRAWALPENQGAGTVGVTFTVDDDPAGPIPDVAKVAEVQAHIDVARPVTANVTVFAPLPIALDPEITLTPNTPIVQAAVQASLEDLLRREAVPGGTILLSHLREAISVAAGEIDHSLVSPVADVALNAGELAVLGTITW